MDKGSSRRWQVYFSKSQLKGVDGIEPMVKLKRVFVLVLVWLVATGGAHAQQQPKTRILFLLDASYSMEKNWKGESYWSTVKRSLYEMADSMSKLPNVEWGLRVFGHTSRFVDNNCKDSKLEVSFGNGTPLALKKRLEMIRPIGITPLAYAMERCAADFQNTLGQSRNFIVFITDGAESCGGDPCAVAQALERNNIVLKPVIIGIQLQQQTVEELGCIGKVFNTQAPSEFTEQLKKVVEESVAKTTLQINLNDINGKATETGVAMTLYDSESNMPKYHFYHCMNSRGVPDTLSISPVFTYDITVHTIPEVTVRGVTIHKMKHNVVDIAAPQGTLLVGLDGNVSKSASVDKLKCLVKKAKSEATLNVQGMNTTEKYLAGSYDIDVLTLPRIYLKDVKVDQSKTTHVKIPAPGVLTLNKSVEQYGAIFTMEGGKLQKLYDLSGSDNQETVALQPGKYKIIYRSKFAKTIHTTFEKEFEIISAGAMALKL
jgi:Ca-activated chloride channel family protein